jgi:hypothetical protein
MMPWLMPAIASGKRVSGRVRLVVRPIRSIWSSSRALRSLRGPKISRLSFAIRSGINPNVNGPTADQQAEAVRDVVDLADLKRRALELS